MLSGLIEEVYWASLNKTLHHESDVYKLSIILLQADSSKNQTVSLIEMRVSYSYFNVFSLQIEDILDTKSIAKVVKLPLFYSLVKKTSMHEKCHV